MLTDALSLGSAAGSIVRPGARRTGVDRYDINSLGTEFVSQVLRERGNRRITNRGDVIAGAPRRAAADVDDAPPTIFDKMRRDSPRGTQVTGDFDVHVEKQICAGNLLDLRRGNGATRRSRVIDQNVDAAQLACRHRDKRLDRGVVSHVGDNRDNAAAGRLGDFCGGRLELFSTPRSNHDLHTFLSQLPRNRLADAAAATCHDGALAAQLQIHEPPLPLPPT